LVGRSKAIFFGRIFMKLQTTTDKSKGLDSKNLPFDINDTVSILDYAKDIAIENQKLQNIIDEREKTIAEVAEIVVNSSMNLSSDEGVE